MDSSTQRGQVLDLAGVLAREGNADEVLAAALPLLLDISGAAAVLVFSRTAAGLQLTTRAGLELAAEAAQDGWLDPAPETPQLSDVAVPAFMARPRASPGSRRTPSPARGTCSPWRGRVRWTSLPSWPSPSAPWTRAWPGPGPRRAWPTWRARVDSAQQLAEMGDYDWHIPSDTNTWSDQLFRIYGYEPGSFHPSYEKFLSLIHPEDRDRISAVHQQAYATGEPYQMIERIVRPDGEVRYLSSNGEVILDADNTPVRMRGTCVDITERVLGDRERERIAARFQGLVESAPDAILVLGDDLRVMEANQRAHELLGGEPRGHRIHEILPGWPDNGTSAVRASGLRGNDLELDVTTVVVKPTNDADPAGNSDSNTVVALFLRDAERPARARGDGGPARRGPAAPAAGTGDQRQRRTGTGGGALQPGPGIDLRLRRLSRAHPRLGAGHDGRPARPPRRARAATRRSRPHRTRGHRRASPACPAHGRRPWRSVPTGSWSWTTPRTSGCCCVSGWRHATD